MSNVRNYVYRDSTWEPLAPNFHQFAPTASDQKLVVTTASTKFAAFESTVTHVWWQSMPTSSSVMARFSGSAPTATCGIQIQAGASGFWGVSLAACAIFISDVTASLFAVPMV